MLRIRKKTLRRVGLAVFTLATVVGPAAYLLLADGPPPYEADLALVGNPLRHIPEQAVVYAIGDDLVDRGGSSEQDRGRAREDPREPTFRLDG